MTAAALPIQFPSVQERFLPASLAMPSVMPCDPLDFQRQLQFQNQAGLQIAGAKDSKVSDQSKLDSIRQTIGGLVSAALVIPAMAMLRESPFLEGPMAPGTGERRFGPLLDQALGDRVIGAAGLPIIDAVVRRYAAQAGIMADRSTNAAPDASPGHTQQEVIDAAA